MGFVKIIAFLGALCLLALVGLSISVGYLIAVQACA